MNNYLNKIKYHFNSMDDDLKKQYKIGYFILMILVMFYSLYGIYSSQKKTEENLVAVERSSLITFRFLEYRENENGSFIDLVNTENGKKYENIFISASCPKGLEKKPGLLMKLYAVKYVNFTTNETIYRFNRLYDYMCTRKDMVKEDEELLKKIKEGSELYIRQLIQESESNSQQKK